MIKKIIASKTEPSKECLWLKGDTLLHYSGNGWRPIKSGNITVAYNTPSGHPMHDAFVLAGGVWTPYEDLPRELQCERSFDNGGFWSYRVDEGGLEDITTEEFWKIFLFFNPTAYSASHQYDVGYSDDSMLIRTNISKLSTAVNVNFGYAAWFQKKMEVFFPFAKRTGFVNIMNSAWRNCASLKRIAGEINVRSCTTAASVDNTFSGAPLLEEVRLTDIATSISFKDQPNLSNASMLHAIQNVLPTASGVVLTLHPDAYARAMADPEIVAALETHTNISIASA